MQIKLHKGYNMMEGDGNLAALANYLNEQEKAGYAEHNFNEEIEEAKIQLGLEEMQDAYNDIAEKYEGYEMPSFKEFINENI